MKFNTLSEWLQFLETAHTSEIDLGLDRVREVARRLELFSPAKRVIMVGGTNGKGSTVTMCASILRQAGFSVGCYMSPHLHVYNERVQINGQQVTDVDLMESFQVIEDARDEISLTYFEVGTLSAYYLFKKYALDVAVVEVGLGGRLDAVNIIDADTSIVTSVGLDHQDWLGHDVSKIAFEKAGIYRAGKPAICGQRDPESTLREHCENIHAPLFVKGSEFNFAVTAQTWSWVGQNAKREKLQFKQLPLPSLPIENAATALQALVLFEPTLSETQIHQGFKNASLAGRLQGYESPIKLLLDVGHNAQAAELLNAYLLKNPVRGKRYGLLAMLVDKDPLAVVEQMQGSIDSWQLAGLDGYRGQTVAQLAQKVSSIVSDASAHESVVGALNIISEQMVEGDELVVFGSFITVAKAQQWVAEQLHQEQTNG